MSDLRLKVRNKIYTSGNHITDTRNSSNSIVVFLGDMSSEKLRPYIDSFLKDTLKSQIQPNKISLVQVDQNNMSRVPELISASIKKLALNQGVRNKIHISFVTIMDDDLYSTEHRIDISAIEELKISVLGGFAVEMFYDFYGIFVSNAKYDNRLNAKKTIINFLNTENGGVNIRKRIYHQACPGDDYFRSARSITFTILVNLIEKIDQHTVIDSTVQGDDYSWTTFSLFEKNLASLVIYEMVNKLLENQIHEVEIISAETINHYIKQTLNDLEVQMKKIASVNDVGYIPLVVRKLERQLSFGEKASNIFKREKVSPVSYRFENEDVSISDLILQQSAAIDKYIDSTITDDFIEKLIVRLIKTCTVMSSINDIQNEALILRCLIACKKELQVYESGASQFDYYMSKYNEMINNSKINIIDRMIDYFTRNIDRYVEMVQICWNDMNLEVNNLISDFAAFHTHFDGIGDLINDKTINLLSTYDDILEKIDIQSVIRAINQNPEIYSNILSSYYDNIQTAGEIVQKFGNCNIVPDIGNVTYCLFSSLAVNCPGRLRLVNDDYWFREYEIAILFTAKNNISDCSNLPFQV